MSTRDWQVFVQDITLAGQEILQFTNQMDYEDFVQDTKTLRAVSLNFIIIGEAASKIPEAFQEAHTEIPWRLLRAMRNRLVHAYFEIDPKLLWDTIKHDLPSLIQTLENLSS